MIALFLSSLHLEKVWSKFIFLFQDYPWITAGHATSSVSLPSLDSLPPARQVNSIVAERGATARNGYGIGKNSLRNCILQLRYF